MTVPYSFWDMHTADTVSDLPEKVTIHGHCWLCEKALFQVVYEPVDETNKYIWHCEDCDVREHGIRCLCGVQPADAA